MRVIIVVFAGGKKNVENVEGQLEMGDGGGRWSCIRFKVVSQRKREREKGQADRQAL